MTAAPLPAIGEREDPEDVQHLQGKPRLYRQSALDDASTYKRQLSCLEMLSMDPTGDVGPPNRMTCVPTYSYVHEDLKEHGKPNADLCNRRSYASSSFELLTSSGTGAAGPRSHSIPGPAHPNPHRCTRPFRP